MRTRSRSGGRRRPTRSLITSRDLVGAPWTRPTRWHGRPSPRSTPRAVPGRWTPARSRWPGRMRAAEPDGDEKLDLRFVHDPADDPCCQESQQQASTQIYDQRPVGEVRPDPPGSPNGNEVTGIGPQDSPDTDQDCGLSKQDALTSVGSHDGVGALGAANLLWSTSPVPHHTGLRGPLPCLPTNSSASPVGRLSDGQSGV